MSSSGCSQAAKCPPLSSRLKWMSLGYARSTQLRGGASASSGKTLTATGMATPFGTKKAILFSQYRRAEETAVFVNQ